MKKLPIFLCASTAIALSACGGSGQDDGSISTYNQSISGVAIDGYVARATVYIDTNNSGSRDPWEDFAYTDNDGYYSSNPITGVDYCADNGTEEQQQFCLSVNTPMQDVVIRISGGYDVLSGQPFEGQMSRRIPDTDSGLDVIISPFTSLLTDLENDSERDAVIAGLGLTAEDLDVNYLDTDGSGEIDEELLSLALKIHKTVAILNDRITDTYNELGESYGVPSDASSSVYPNLARELLTSSASFEEVVANANLMVNVLDNTETTVREAYELRELSLPADQGSPENSSAFTRTTEIIAQIPAVVESVFSDEELDGDEATGAARILEVVIIKALEERNEDPSLDSAIEFITDETNEANLATLSEALASDTADVNALAANDFVGSDFDSAEEIADAAQLPEDARPFSLLPGTRLRVSDLDLGQGPDQLEDNEVEFYFEGMPGDTEGAFTACVKFIEEGNTLTNTVSSISTRGEFIEGYWSLLDGDNSYNLLLTIELFGSSYSGILKPAGFVEIEGVEFQLIRGDADGEFRIWYSELGVQDAGNIPQNDSDCEAALPSRIGL